MSSISAGGATRYTVTSMNAREQLTGATYGGSITATYGFDSYGYPTSTQTGTIQDYRYSFDPYTGNLSSRQNYLRGESESFGYDNLDRLTSVTGPQNLTMTFQDNGNINTKSDIGSTPFQYGIDAGPYALSKVSSSTGVIPTAAQSVSSYNSFQKLVSIGEDGNTASFLYNADHERARMIQTGSNSFTRWYHGESYMRETSSLGTKDYIYLGGDAYSAPVAAVVENGTPKYHYLLRDYLGNITHDYDSSNGETHEYSFDAWGRRRNPADWGYNVSTEPELFAGRGFTGHEFLKEFNVYNMNGRLYDPLVGRFLSADIMVQAPDDSQSYNRYSYCWNNPLKFTDPSGYILFMRWADYFNPAEEGRRTTGGGGGGGYRGYIGWDGQFYYNGTGGGFMESSNDHIKYAGDNDVIHQDEVTGEWLNRAGKPVFDKEKQNYVNRNSYGETLAVWSGITKDPYQTLMGFIFPDGSTFYFGTGYTPSNSSRQRDWDLNGDSQLQKNEADKWWLNGGGDIWVDNAKIDWSGLKIPKGVSTGGTFAISTTQAFLKLPYATAATYGGTSFKVISPSQVKVLDQLYHYQYRPNDSAENIIRNFMNWYGKPKGQGKDFMIHYYYPLIIIK